ncbi:hypothetical protein Pfo_020343 [Paulownia fortunei]|nr:hypothetical protein Pfo_020343 [Paulownia fortunei]
MAAYAALVSLTHILHQILHPPPTHQIIIDREQIESLQEKVSFLIDFLENYSSRRSKEIEDLETRIADAAYAAEDIIESNVMNQILAKSLIDKEKCSILLCEDIQRVIGKFPSIEKELLKIKDKKGMENLQSKNSTVATSSRPLPSGKNTTVGFDKHLIQIMRALSTNESNRQIISIVGMGGIGKTTLATNIYNNPFIVEHFYIRAWITISQEYTVRKLLLGLLHQIDNADPNEQERSDDQLGELLHKQLFDNKYLIVMDDMWDIQAWDDVKRFLPSNTNGSRILVTTRLSKLAVNFGSFSYQIDFLDKTKSWHLLRKKVFAEEGCPVELEKIGKNIAKRCRGLPLAIVVIGGLLAKSKRTREHWESVERDVTSIVNNENDEHFMKILSLSYRYLPIYLKPCFLYFAMFPEDFAIRVSRLIRLWVAEGFIKSTRAKSLEEVAEEYLEDLIDRNLILVRKQGSSGKVKTCSIHDLLMDLCRREAHKDKFLRIAMLDSPNISPYIKSERCLSIHCSKREKKVCKASRLATLNRSLSSYFEWNSRWNARRFSLLRLLDVADRYSIDEILQLINSKHVACTMYGDINSALSSISLLWNLQTLVVDGQIPLPAEIWQMPQLRHVKIRTVRLCDPPDAQMDGQNVIVLENLQRLSTVKDFRCTEQVFKRIPYLKKLGITYNYRSKELGSYCLSNLVRFHKLESLVLTCNETFLGNIAFPSSLKKLTLRNCMIPWEDMSIVGSLPHLEVLKLLSHAAKGQHWNPIEGEFYRLKFLLIDDCELEIWEADNSHFPRLERLVLRLKRLKEIPLGFAEMPTLQMIKCRTRTYNSVFLWRSAKKLSKQRESLGYEGLQLL